MDGLSEVRDIGCERKSNKKIKVRERGVNKIDSDTERENECKKI